MRDDGFSGEGTAARAAHGPLITIQSTLLVALGFLSATLLALLFAPAFWSRAVRLTALRIKESLPVTETEIRADKDRLRAEYAIRVHKLETQVEQSKIASARQTIDLSKRDTRIGELTSELETLKHAFEETSNARRVLHATVSDRLPRVEQRLVEARLQLQSRDHEMGELATTAERQSKALAEAATINQQQMAEIERLATTLAARSERNHDTLADPRFDAEVALRAEIEALRAKTRDQSALITRMQGMMQPTLATTAAAVAATAARSAPADMTSALPKSSSDDTANVPDARKVDASAASVVTGHSVHEGDLRQLRSTNEDQAAEITRLKSALAVYELASGDEKAAGKESRISLKAKLTSVQAQSALQAETIQRLRTELAAVNERLALQANHFRDELRRLGTGTLPTSGTGRRPGIVAPRLSLAERVADRRAPRLAAAGAEVEVARASVVKISSLREGTAPGADQPRSTADAADHSAAISPADDGVTSKVPPIGTNGRKAAAIGRQTASADDEARASEGTGAKPEAEARANRPRLLDRISNLAKLP